MNILIVEDDIDLGNVLKHYLQLQGFVVQHITESVQAIDYMQQTHFDLCILDVMMPQLDGFTLGQRIGNHRKMPFIFLTAKDGKEDRLRGLRLGAQDYITKPFEPEELLLRINNILKRRGTQFVCHFGKYLFDKDNLILKSHRNEYTLTQKEAAVLDYFLTRPEQLIKKSAILVDLWGSNDYFLGRSLDVFISRLRKYLAEDEAITIENIRGVGFKMKLPIT